jgi:glutamate formiminotransferase
MFECVINISEGRDLPLLEQIARAGGTSLRDRHRDRHHNRSVFTLINEPDALLLDVHSLVQSAYQHLDLRRHGGVHPRFGIVDVVPFAALAPNGPEEACALRDETAAWFADTLSVPVFLYGPLADGSVRSLPDVRRHAFDTLEPDLGPSTPAPARGAVAVGCRPILVAWNLWLHDVTMDQARGIAAVVRQSDVRALAFEVGGDVQVSCNLLDVAVVPPSQVYDQVRALVPDGGVIERAELVGLAPAALLAAEDPSRWDELGLSEDATIEARLAL